VGTHPTPSRTPPPGDVNGIEIGSNTNIQDNAVIHVSKHSVDGAVRPTVIGNNVTIGGQHS
jgi:carbonic anhydrase/acetyltransferase-like protein (isoleucine patch superfamily)